MLNITDKKVEENPRMAAIRLSAVFSVWVDLRHCCDCVVGVDVPNRTAKRISCTGIVVART